MYREISRRRFVQTLLAAVASTNTVKAKPDKQGSVSASDTLLGRTQNHRYSYPIHHSGEWTIIEDTLGRIDADIEIRDRSKHRDEYSPRAGAKFVDVETGATFIADGETWHGIETTGTEPTFKSVDSDRYNGVIHVDPSDGYERLQNVLTELGDQPGTVVLGPGRFDDIVGNVIVPSNTVLTGQGRSATTLAFADGADLPLAGLLRIEGRNVTISHLELDGNRTNVRNDGREYGLYTSGANRVTVVSVTCRNFPGYGFDPHADGPVPSRHITFWNCLSRNNGLDGFTFAGVEHGVLSDCVALENGRHGINGTDEEGDGLTVTGCVSRDNGRTGLTIQNTYGNLIAASNTIEGNGTDGIRIGNGDSVSHHTTIANNRLRDNRRYGINLRACRSVIVSGNQLHGNNVSGTATAEIATTGTPDGARELLVTDNQFRPRKNTDHAIDERDGEGPLLAASNVIRGVSKEPIYTAHPDSIAGMNLIL